MAFGTSSKVFANTVKSSYTGAHAFNLNNSDTIKVALYTNSSTPDNTVTTDALTEYNGTSSAWVTANESSATGYTAGGLAISTTSVAQSSNVVTFTSSGNPTWTITSGTLSSYGCLVYDTTVSNIGICYNAFATQPSTVTGGQFIISWNASGIATFTT